MLQNIIKNISLEYRGDDAGLPPYINRTGNFFYGNYLFLLDEITDEKCFYAIADLTRFVTDPENKGKKLNILINSSGGSVMIMNTISGLLNVAKFNDMEISTFVYGIAASAASVIAVQGTIRLMSRNALHFVHFGMIPQYLTKVTEIDKSHAFVKQMQHQAETTYLKYCPNLTKEAYLKLIEDEMGYLSAEDCLALGFCDGIIEDELEAKQEEDSKVAAALQKLAEEEEKLELKKQALQAKKTSKKSKSKK